MVELVVVIAIFGILAAIAVPRLSASRKRAAITAHNANVRTLMSAATMYIADGGEATTWEGKDSEDWGKYLQEWPTVHLMEQEEQKSMENLMKLQLVLMVQ